MEHTYLRKITLILMTVIGSFSTILAQEGYTSEEFNLLIGTYTEPGKSEGIYVYKFNGDTGEYSYRAEATGIKNPSYLTVSKDGKRVYAVSEVGGGEGSVIAFSFDPVSGKLDFLNRASSGGDGPCYVSVDDKNKFVFVANYGGGSLSAVPVNADGSVGSDIQSIQYEGSSILKNQERPHVHSTVLSPDNKYLYVADLGTDKLNIYNVDFTTSSPLTPEDPPFVKIEAGNGPRHFTFHPNGKFAYLIQEMTGNVTVFNYHDGKLLPKQSVTLSPQGYKGRIDAADIHISPDGNFLYGSLRGDIDEIVIYAINKKGELTYSGRQSSLGKNPRNFAIDPTGNFLLVGNGGSDEIVIFKRNKQTGLLIPTGNTIKVNSPVCLKFVPLK
ncbi:hypothetical protein LCGC14_1480310 [marine sediment metagenome]|uniref:Lactonase family protein n=2 Tax=root TaxID=1 RepID=A0A831QQS4_9FLAO|nr:lactonase family protein [Pricia antarctica]